MKPIYDVALSFAGEQREYVRAVAGQLKASDVTYFFDEDNEVDLWGRNMVDQFDAVYRSRSRFVVMFVSSTYASKTWPRLERQSAQATAIERLEPYILPVRFDDTDLPGLPSTTYVKDARKTSPADLAELIIAKVTLDRASDKEEDRGPGWEYYLFFTEIAAGLGGYGPQWRDFTLGVARPQGPLVATHAVHDDLQTRLAVAKRLVSNVNRLLSSTATEGAFGAPGEPGDADGIRHLAAAVVDVYAGLLRWAAEVRAAVVPDEAIPIYDALPKLVREPLLRFHAFVDQFESDARPALDRIRAGDKPDQPIEIILTLTLAIDDEASAELNQAIADFADSL
jgi:TIR domain-containing protein